MAEQATLGVHRKYEVRRTDGRDVGSCFVLDLADPRAWPALRTWADTVEQENPVLASDVRRLVAEQETLRG